MSEFTVFQATILAIVQGLTEFLPISSTAHLAIVPWLLHWRDPGLTFDVALHAGTLLAVLVFFFRTWIHILRAALGGKVVPLSDDNGQPLSGNEASSERMLLWFLVAATIPAGIAGILLEKRIETTFRNPAIMAFAMIFVALLMWCAESVGLFSKPLSRTTFGDAVAVGVAQAAALIPGVSRSGSTITAGIFRGMTRDAAARFSFLLSTPVIAGAVLLKLHEVHKHGIPPEMRVPFVVGMIVSALVGYASIAWFIRYLRTNTLKIFIVYRLIFGTIILALAYFAHFR
jgi:undecaprenyl-diphosphatase